MQGSRTANVTGVTLGLFGLIYNGVVGAILAGAVERTEIETYIMSVAGLLLIVTVAGLFLFRETAEPLGSQASSGPAIASS